MKQVATFHYFLPGVTLAPEVHQRHIDWTKDIGADAALISDLGASYNPNYQMFTAQAAQSGLMVADYLEFQWEDPNLEKLRDRLKQSLVNAEKPNYWKIGGKPVIGIFLMGYIPEAILKLVYPLLWKFYVIADGWPECYPMLANYGNCLANYMEPQDPTWMAIQARYGKWDPPAIGTAGFAEWQNTFLWGFERAPGRICGGIIPYYKNVRSIATALDRDLAVNLSYHYDDTTGFNPPRPRAFHWGSREQDHFGALCAAMALQHAKPDILLVKTSTETAENTDQFGCNFAQRQIAQFKAQP